MKKMVLTFILVFSALSVVFGLTGKEIVTKARYRYDGDTKHALMGMDLIDADGTTTKRIMEVWSVTYNKKDDLTKTVMSFIAPASIKNTRYLQIQNKNRDDDKWIYLPGLGRVRRIASSQGDQSFVGSDFSYDDLETREVDEDTHKLLREEKLGKYDCYVVESVPKTDWDYSKRIVWITKDTFVPVKAELYSKKTGKLQKVLTVKQNLKKVNGIWTIFETTMKDVEKNHTTKLYIMKNKKNGKYFLEYNKKISPKRFTQAFLKTGRAK